MAFDHFDEIWRKAQSKNEYSPFNFTAEDVFSAWKKSYDERQIDRTKYDSLIQAIYDAIKNEGISPDHHRRVMRKHRRQWPTLWRAIDNLLEEFEKSR